MNGFTDFHCHILPGLDDGAVDPSESLGMARVLESFGFTRIHCTPHLSARGYQNYPARVSRATASLQRLLDGEGIALSLTPGTEHYLDQGLFHLLSGALPVGGTDYLLVEAPFRSERAGALPLFEKLLDAGRKLLIAHPERCGAFEPKGGGTLETVLGRKSKKGERSLLLDLLEKGCRFQGNLGSFAGYYGSQVRDNALAFLGLGGYSCLGSDAHSADSLDFILREGEAVVTRAVGAETAALLLRGDLLA